MWGWGLGLHMLRIRIGEGKLSLLQHLLRYLICCFARSLLAAILWNIFLEMKRLTRSKMEKQLLSGAFVLGTLILPLRHLSRTAIALDKICGKAERAFENLAAMEDEVFCLWVVNLVEEVAMEAGVEIEWREQGSKRGI